MLRGYFKTSGNMVFDNSFQVFLVSGIYIFITRPMHDEVVTDTGADKAMFYLRVFTNLVV